MIEMEFRPGMIYMGDFRDVMHGREDPEKYIQIFEPRVQVPASPTPSDTEDSFELLYSRPMRRR